MHIDDSQTLLAWSHHCEHITVAAGKKGKKIQSETHM